MTESLAGRVAVVSGAARGIGRACAVRLAQRGADVAVLDIDLRSGARYADEPPGTTVDQIEALGRRAIGVQADLADETQAHQAIDVAKAVEFLVSDLSAFVTGRCVPVDGGWVLNPS